MMGERERGFIGGKMEILSVGFGEVINLMGKLPILVRIRPTISG